MDQNSLVVSHRQQALLKYDRIIYSILLAHLPLVMFVIPIGYDTMEFAIGTSVVVGLIATAAYFMARGTRLFGIVAGVLLMAFSAIMIQAQMGRIEMHFHIFGALALLLIYRDWLTIVAAAAAIAVHHLLFTALQLNDVQALGLPVTLFNYGCSWSIAFLHAAFVVFESAILIYYSMMMRQEEITGIQLVSAIQQLEDKHDLSIRIDDHSGKNEVASAFNNMVSSFDALIADLSQASAQLSENAINLANTSQITHANISSQHQKTEQAATAMTEMSATIQEVAQNAQQAADVAGQVNSQAQSGSEIVNNAINMTNQLISSMGNASDSIQQLESNTQSIGSFVDVINGISEQTNLLALNAAIEAARAGEQGRGFAVVADEVRSLAQRSQESTSEIQAIIESLQSVTEQAVNSINLGQEKTGETAQEIGRAGTELQAIVDGIATINSMNTQIATAAEQQSVVAESITENIVSISDLSKDSVNQIAQNQSTSDSLKMVATELDAKVHVYRT